MSPATEAYELHLKIIHDNPANLSTESAFIPTPLGIVRIHGVVQAVCCDELRVKDERQKGQAYAPVVESNSIGFYLL